ncbi:MAG TPA: antitoxin Phd/YefM, type II toxin-antitoxin system domain protein [Terriglobia bacterium]|nr:antitoxin Phd/YefM, type II toxin-antitoxin system domain protein [Terriglobia bacterium]
MKTATIREVQHNLSKILRWVEDGEEVLVTKHKRIVANIVPSTRRNGELKWPDFGQRMKKISLRPVGGKPLSRIISEERDERL